MAGTRRSRRQLSQNALLPDRDIVTHSIPRQLQPKTRSIVTFTRFQTATYTRKMHPSEISFLVLQDKQGFHTRMTIDDWPCAIKMYEIDPNKNILTIVVSRNL
jgi:hypothetical protein